jgi:C4-dicarboxylate transporter DctQ subunit
MPLGSYLMCFRFLQVTVSFVRTGELPHHDHGHVDGLDEEVPPRRRAKRTSIYAHGDNLHPSDVSKNNDGGRS